jgi:hypothetical protein
MPLSGDYAKARAELEESIRLNPSYATAHENLGDVHAMLAADAYGRAQRLEPGKHRPAAQARAGAPARRTASGPIAASSPTAKTDIPSKKR